MPVGIYDRTKSKPRPPQSEESKIKIGLANKGKRRTPQQIQNIKNSLPKNRKNSKETRKKISNSNKGKRHNWKNGQYIMGGYRVLYKPNHPSARQKGYVLEHRYIIEKHLNRILLPTEIVHHINENKLDNRIENLIVFKGIGYHKAFHKFQECLKIGISFYSGYPLLFSLQNKP